MLVVFPLGLLSLVWVFDVVHLATGGALSSQVAFYLLSCGIVGGLVAAVPGLIDWLTLPPQTRAFRVALAHMLINLSAMLLFALSWVLRVVEGVPRSGVLPFVLAVVGFLVMLVGGWLGGELVERHGVGVYPDAGLDAPPSLAPRGEREPRAPGRHPTEPSPA